MMVKTLGTKNSISSHAVHTATVQHEVILYACTVYDYIGSLNKKFVVYGIACQKKGL